MDGPTFCDDAGGTPNEVSMPVVHRIVTHETGRSRDLYGVLRLSRVSGDPAVVDIRYLDEPYALESPIPVIESGHSGCGEHTWHSGVATFTVTPRNVGEVTLKAQVDPDPECCEGDGVPTVEAQVTATVIEADAVLTADLTTIPAASQWQTILPYAGSNITVTWEPVECEGTLQIVGVVGDGGYVPPGGGGTVEPFHEWWTNAHQHGPGGQQHPPDQDDFYHDLDYLLWKYGGVLATTGGQASYRISTDTCVWCPLPQWCSYACSMPLLEGGYEIFFGTSTFAGSENQAGSIIGHELVHTALGLLAGECPAYRWEADHCDATGICPCDAEYFENVAAYLREHSCP